MDIRQLRFFVECARCGSFSEAAKKLYSTQSTVSKAIKTLEDTLGIQLFDRQPRGIVLTEQAKGLSEHACRILKEMDEFEACAGAEMTKWIRVSLNPSSWFSDQFVKFYQETQEKNYHFEINTAGIRVVMERVRDYLDDLGLVYVLESQKEDFLYELSRSHLQFELLQVMEMRVYPGGGSRLSGEETGPVTLQELKKMRFIQNYQDEFLQTTLGAPEEFDWKKLDVAVITNSDYIMERMLREGNVVNISGSYLTPGQRSANYGRSLELSKDRVLFGYLSRQGENMDAGVSELIDFLKKQLENN